MERKTGQELGLRFLQKSIWSQFIAPVSGTYVMSLKPCPHWRPNSATVAVYGNSRWIRRLLPNSVTNCRRLGDYSLQCGQGFSVHWLVLYSTAFVHGLLCCSACTGTAAKHQTGCSQRIWQLDERLQAVKCSFERDELAIGRTGLPRRPATTSLNVSSAWSETEVVEHVWTTLGTIETQK